MGESLALVVIVIVIFWFFLLRPQQQSRRKHQEVLRSLQIGDEVISAGGLVGRVTRLPQDDGWIGFELSPGFETKLLTAAISHRIPADQVDDNLGHKEPDV